MENDIWRRGACRAYLPEYNDSGGEWKTVPFFPSPDGVPQPSYNAGVNMTLDLCGYEQAQALAWTYAAHAIANGQRIKVRIQEYEVVYDVKAKKIGPSTTDSTTK